jgi:hypothetical protein
MHITCCTKRSESCGIEPMERGLRKCARSLRGLQALMLSVPVTVLQDEAFDAYLLCAPLR